MKALLFVALVSASVYCVYQILKPREDEDEPRNSQGFDDGNEDDNHLHI